MSPCNSRRRARRSGSLRHHAHSEMLLGQPSSAMNAEDPTQVHGHTWTRVFRRGRLPIQLRHYVLSCATVGSDPPPPTLPARGMAERQLKPRRALRRRTLSSGSFPMDIRGSGFVGGKGVLPAGAPARIVEPCCPLLLPLLRQLHNPRLGISSTVGNFPERPDDSFLDAIDAACTGQFVKRMSSGSHRAISGTAIRLPERTKSTLGRSQASSLTGDQADIITDDMERRMKAPMQFAYRELATPCMVWLVAGISFSLMAIVAALGPMGTLHTLTFIQRLAYCGVITIVEVPICFASGWFTLYVMRNRRLIQLTLALALMCSFVVAPAVPMAVVLYGLFRGGVAPTANLAEIYAFGMLIFGTGTGLSVYVLYLRITPLSQRNRGAIVSSEGSPSGLAGSLDTNAAVSVPRTLASASDDPPQISAPAPARDSAADAPDATVETSGAQPPHSGVGAPELRLPPEIGEDIVYAHVSGHYVEVVTTAGAAVVMIRLSDVARALDGQGIQTHRSYWAAYGHIVRLQSTDHRGVLHLTAGHKIPVSRSFHRAVRAFMANRNNPPR